jgi:hypothetical protein
VLPALVRLRAMDILAARELLQVTPEALDCLIPPRDPRVRSGNMPTFTFGSDASGFMWCRKPTGADQRRLHNGKAMIFL